MQNFSPALVAETRPMLNRVGFSASGTSLKEAALARSIRDEGVPRNRKPTSKRQAL